MPLTVRIPAEMDEAHAIAAILEVTGAQGDSMWASVYSHISPRLSLQSNNLTTRRNWRDEASHRRRATKCSGAHQRSPKT